jgi:hypothetical protein
MNTCVASVFVAVTHELLRTVRYVRENCRLARNSIQNLNDWVKPRDRTVLGVRPLPQSNLQKSASLADLGSLHN